MTKTTDPAISAVWNGPRPDRCPVCGDVFDFGVRVSGEAGPIRGADICLWHGVVVSHNGPLDVSAGGRVVGTVAERGRAFDVAGREDSS